MATAYQTEEQALGRNSASTDIPALSHMLIGSVHLPFTDHESGPPDAGAIYKVIATAIRGPVSARGALQRVKLASVSMRQNGPSLQSVQPTMVRPSARPHELLLQMSSRAHIALARRGPVRSCGWVSPRRLRFG